VKDEEASAALEQFPQLFPRSLRLREAAQVLTLRPDSIFPAQQPAPASDPGPPEAEDDAPESKTLNVAACAGQIVTDPLFVFLWLAVTFILSEFARHISMQLVIFLSAFALTAFIRIDWTHAWRMMSVDEKSSRQEADHALVLNKASLAERGENYPKAAGLYEEVLQADPLNIQSRFNLARLYLDRLHDQSKAVVHLKKLIATAPPDHPYRQFADEELKKNTGTA
jgi:tetratricopeptide (TPR) repeat protein